MKVFTAFVPSLLVAALVGSGTAMADASGKVDAIDGKEITVSGKEYTISSKRTDVTVNGKAATRDEIEAGMECTVVGPDGGEAKTVDCK